MLYGLGGCGKTSIALEIASDFLASGGLCWWVEPIDETQFVTSLRIVALQAGLSNEDIDRPDLPDLLWQQLESLNRPWLLIFDNADDPTILTVGTQPLSAGTGWLRPLPSGTCGSVLVTSRTGERAVWGDWPRLHLVGMLDAQAGSQVLTDREPGAGTPTDAESLASRLGGLPLALKIAGAYLQETRRSLLDEPEAIKTFIHYREEIERGNTSLLNDPSSLAANLLPEQEMDARRTALARTWELSLDLIERRGLPHARPLLRVLASLADADIPYRLLLDPSAIVRSPLMIGASSASISKSLASLADFRLIELGSGKPPATGGHVVETLRIHPLVRDMSAKHLAISTDYVAMSAELVSLAVGKHSDPERPQSWEYWHKLAPHCTHLLQFAHGAIAEGKLVDDSIVLGIASAARCAAIYQYSQGLYILAVETLESVHEVISRVLGPKHRVSLESLHWISVVKRDDAWQSNNEPIPASILDDTRRVYQISAEEFGEHDPLTLKAHHALAVALAYSGRQDEARLAYRLVYESRREQLGDDHPDTVEVRLGLAARLFYSEQYTEARDEFQIGYEAECRIFGSDDPRTLSSKDWIASCLEQLDDLASAVTMSRELFHARLKIHSSTHPEVGFARSKLRNILIKHGRFLLEQSEPQVKES